jgi:hypothetical protein
VDDAINVTARWFGKISNFVVTLGLALERISAAEVAREK